MANNTPSPPIVPHRNKINERNAKNETLKSCDLPTELFAKMKPTKIKPREANKPSADVWFSLINGAVLL
jgi:hypothetical protein